jgi:hypothetical protein
MVDPPVLTPGAAHRECLYKRKRNTPGFSNASVLVMITQLDGVLSPDRMVSQKMRHAMYHPMGRDGGAEHYEVATAVKVCLRKSPYSDIRNLSCDYDHGVLVLRGRLASYYEKQLAQVVVAKLPGIAQLVNEIEVAAAPQP